MCKDKILPPLIVIESDVDKKTEKIIIPKEVIGIGVINTRGIVNLKARLKEKYSDKKIEEKMPSRLDFLKPDVQYVTVRTGRCRGYYCIGHEKRLKNEKVLRLKFWDAGGYVCILICEKCIPKFFEQMQTVMIK